MASFSDATTVKAVDSHTYTGLFSERWCVGSGQSPSSVDQGKRTTVTMRTLKSPMVAMLPPPSSPSSTYTSPQPYVPKINRIPSHYICPLFDALLSALPSSPSRIPNLAARPPPFTSRSRRGPRPGKKLSATSPIQTSTQNLALRCPPNGL